MLQLQNTPNRATEIPRYLAVLNQIEKGDEFEFVPKYVGIAIW